MAAACRDPTVGGEEAGDEEVVVEARRGAEGARRVAEVFGGFEGCGMGALDELFVLDEGAEGGDGGELGDAVGVEAYFAAGAAVEVGVAPGQFAQEALAVAEADAALEGVAFDDELGHLVFPGR